MSAIFFGLIGNLLMLYFLMNCALQFQLTWSGMGSIERKGIVEV